MSATQTITSTYSPANSTWADAPFKLISSTSRAARGIPRKSEAAQQALHMCAIHNTVIRQLNAVYQQAPYVKEKDDIADFLAFTKFTIEQIHSHHKHEEEIYFPEIDRLTGRKDTMEQNIEQHEKFLKPFNDWEKYVEKATPTSFEARKFQRLMDSFGHELSQHLAEEIDTILDLIAYDEKKLKAAWDAVDKAVGKELSLYTDGPMTLGSQDNTWQIDGETIAWPPKLPFFVPYLVHYVHGRKHAGAWRFLPSDMHGNKRPLQFAS